MCLYIKKIVDILYIIELASYILENPTGRRHLGRLRWGVCQQCLAEIAAMRASVRLPADLHRACSQLLAGWLDAAGAGHGGLAAAGCGRHRCTRAASRSADVVDACTLCAKPLQSGNGRWHPGGDTVTAADHAPLLHWSRPPDRRRQTASACPDSLSTLWGAAASRNLHIGAALSSSAAIPAAPPGDRHSRQHLGTLRSTRASILGRSTRQCLPLATPQLQLRWASNAGSSPPGGTDAGAPPRQSPPVRLPQLPQTFFESARARAALAASKEWLCRGVGF